MKFWQLTAPRQLHHEANPNELKLKEKSAKVKITHALLSDCDISAFLGESNGKYPRTIGRFAIGIATETSEDCYIKKGDRIYLPDVIDDEETEENILIAGETAEGRFLDFTVAEEDKAYILPASVTDEAAFLIDAVALAERIIDEADIKIGDHVLVVGGGMYGNILCQILIYHRIVPILADNNPVHLEWAKKSGIYYTFQNDDNLKNNLLKVTGGKLADAVVYLAFANKSDPSSFFPLVARNSLVAIAAKAKENINVNLQSAIKNNLTIKGITESHEYISTAINLLANKAVNYSAFPYFTHPEEELPSLLEEYSKEDKRLRLTEELHLVKFVI
jgi:threonine dehydrogenase-like Zn-dependent dehydrogenase